jgi:hypothetical protein
MNPFLSLPRRNHNYRNTWTRQAVSETSDHFSNIAAGAGALSSTRAICWGWAHVTGRLPEPACEGVEPEECEVYGEAAGY